MPLLVMELFLPVLVGCLARGSLGWLMPWCACLGVFSFTCLGALSDRAGVMGASVGGTIGALVVLSVWIGGLSVLAEKSSEVSLTMIVILSAAAFLSGDLLSFYFFFESSLIPISWVIIFKGKQPERYRSVHYMILYTVVSSLPLLCWIVYLHDKWGHLCFCVKEAGLASGWAAIFLLWAFLVKLPSFPWHIWLPKAHVEASVGGSMLLAGILLKLGGVGIVRVVGFTALDSAEVFDFCKCLGAWGGVLAGLVCLRETDLKSLVAYSSVSHMAFVSVGLMSMKELGWCGASVLMISHGLSSSGMFFLVNSVYEKHGSRSLLMCGGLLGVVPGLATWWFIGTIFSGGCPPSASLVSEVLVLCSGITSSILLAASVGSIMFLGMAYGFYLYGSVNHGALSPRVGPFTGPSMLVKTVCFLHFIPLGGLLLVIEMLI